MASIRSGRSMMVLLPLGLRATPGDPAAAAEAFKVMLVNSLRQREDFKGLFDLDAVEVKIVDSLLVKENG